MTFLAPILLVAGAAVAAGIVLLHFLARRRPRPAMLPTARFVPDRPARWPSRAPRPTDWLLLAVRVLAVIVIAAAFAGPVRKLDRSVTTRVVLTDRSRGVGDEQAMRDSTLAVLRDGDLLLPFDTMVRIVSIGARDSAARLTSSRAPASLSAALIAAERAAALLRDRADSLELTIVSPFAADGWDEATARLRRRWRGRARLIVVPLAMGGSSPPAIAVRAPRSDPASAAAAPLAADDDAGTRLVRVLPDAADSAWAREAGHVLIHWPRQSGGDSLTAQAVAARNVVVVAPLVRRTVDAGGARVVARFADGAPAVVERSAGDGCIRDVGFDLPRTGDVPLRESVRRFVNVLAAPCAGREHQSALSPARIDSLGGSGALLSTAGVARTSRERSSATPWLLIAGALILMLEVSLRQRVASQS